MANIEDTYTSWENESVEKIEWGPDPKPENLFGNVKDWEKKLKNPVNIEVISFSSDGEEIDRNTVTVSSEQERDRSLIEEADGFVLYFKGMNGFNAVVSYPSKKWIIEPLIANKKWNTVTVKTESVTFNLSWDNNNVATLKSGGDVVDEKTPEWKEIIEITNILLGALEKNGIDLRIK
jgi:hypothetical protein